MRRALALSLVAVLVAVGCGEDGASRGAIVSVYVTAPLCPGAHRELARSGGRVGSIRVRAICLADAGRGRGLNLAAIGADARRATEDSTTVGYIGEPSPAAARFSHPILDEAGIAQLSDLPGDVAMSKLLRAMRKVGDAGNLRAAVLDELRLPS